jgi:ligand-binding sensor domain-containing protein
MTLARRGSVAVCLAGALLAARTSLALDPARTLTEYGLDVWQSEHGLPQNSVQALRQTRNGYLWVGTQEGLVRFDGVRFEVFDTTRGSIANNDVSALLESSDGTLWIGTFGGGLVRFRNGAFRAYGARDGLPTDTIYDLAEDRRGALWIATARAGLVQLKDRRFTAYGPKLGLPSDIVRCVLVDRQDTVWAGTPDGLVRLRDGRFDVLTSKDGLRNNTITALAEDADGVLWIGTGVGLHRLKEGRIEAFTTREGLPHDLVRALAVDREGTLWVGTGRGLARFRDGTFTGLTEGNGLPSDAVIAVREDREGNLWIGTDGGGLARLKDGRLTTRTVRDGLSSDNVYPVTGAGDGGLWLGTYRGEIDRFDGRRFRPLPLPRDDKSASRIRALLEDSRGRLWIGRDRGLLRYASGAFTSFTAANGLPNENVRAIAEDRRGRLWIGTDGGGLVRHDGTGFHTFTTADGLGSNEVRAILEAGDGDLWVGTYGGLSRLRGDRFDTYTTKDGLTHNLVRCLLADEDGTLWIGTYGGGLSRLRGRAFVSYTTRNGLPSDAIYGIVDDGEGHLWMSCNRGIFRVSRKDLEDVAGGWSQTLHPTSFDESDGMKSRECNGGSPACWRTADGRLWFGTLKGVVVVDPRHLKAKAAAPPVVLEELVVDGEPARLVRGLKLPPRRHRLQFRFTALTFSAPQKVRFSYKLEGFDQDWVDAGTLRMASYTQIPPGRYTFRVIARNEDGVWNQAGDAFTFTMTPAFYETPIFRAALTLAALAAGVAFYRLRTRQLRAREKVLEARITEALANLKVLSGLLPICANCKKIRDDKGYWSQIEVYIRDHSEAEFSHSLCNDCVRELYPDIADQVLSKAEPKE